MKDWKHMFKEKNKNIIYKCVYFVCYSHKQQDLQRLKGKLLLVN